MNTTDQPTIKPKQSPDDEYHLVIQKLKSVLDLVKDCDRPIDTDDLRKRFEAVYDKNFVRYIEGEEPTNFEGLLSEVQRLCMLPGLKFQMFRFRRFRPGVIEQKLRYATKKDVYMVFGLFYYRNGLIYRAEVSRSLRERVPGEVWAQDNRIALAVTERDFARQVRTLPPCIHGKLMGAGMGFVPTEDRYEMVQVSLIYEVKNFVHAAVRKNDIIRLVTADGQPYLNGAYFRYSKRKLGSHQSLTLFDRKDKAVAYCERQDAGYLIYGTRPLVRGNHHKYAEPKMEDVGHGIGKSDVVAFYPWFLIKGGRTSTQGSLGFVLALSEVDGEDGEVDFEPIYRLSVGLDARNFVGYISEYDNEHDILGIGKVDKDIFRGNRVGQLNLAPGVDPCVALCIFACMNEVRTNKGTNFAPSVSPRKE